jgi:predicted O-methyltransferase YrrM
MNEGYASMPLIVAKALNEIKAHLWSMYWICRMVRAENIVELGVRSGDSTRALMAAAHDLDAGLISFDIDGDAYRVKEVTENHGIRWLGDNWACIKSDSVEAGQNFVGKVEVVFIDTAHTFEHTKKELIAWHTHVQPGGVIMLHDVGLGAGDAPRDGVQPAIDWFVASEFGKWWRYESYPHIAEGDTGLGILWRQ